MDLIKIVLPALVLLALAVFGLGINIFARNRKFPNTHVGGNKEMSKRGIYCAKTFDRLEQKKVQEEIRLNNLKTVRLLEE